MTAENFDQPKEEIMTSLGDRMIRAAKLDSHLYEEVEADTGASGGLSFREDCNSATAVRNQMYTRCK